jgi:hypothetical protein
MRTLEHRWNQQKIVDDTFAARPTKAKMPEDYGTNIRSAIVNGLLQPESDVSDCQLLFACACGTMLGFRGNQVCGGLLFFVCVRFLLLLKSHIRFLTLPLLRGLIA